MSVSITESSDIQGLASLNTDKPRSRRFLTNCNDISKKEDVHLTEREPATVSDVDETETKSGRSKRSANNVVTEEISGEKDSINESEPAVVDDVLNAPKAGRSRRSVSGSVRCSTPVITSRWFMPLEVKQTAIRRLEDGATQSLVAKDLDVSLSTVASWWRKKDSILGTSQTTTEKPTSDAEDVKENVVKEESIRQESSTDDINVKDEEKTRHDSSPEQPASQINDLGVFELESLMTNETNEEISTENQDNDLSTVEDADLNGENHKSEDADIGNVKEAEEIYKHTLQNVDESKENLDDIDTNVDFDFESHRPGSGLQLIVSNYCSSSDEEL